MKSLAIKLALNYVYSSVAPVCLFLLLTAAAAHAQTGRIRSIAVPFPFTVGGKTLPAGTYSVARNRDDADLVWVIKGRDNREAAMCVTGVARREEPRAEARLVFNRYGGEYYLAEIRPAGAAEGRALSASRWEREVARGGAQPVRETVAASR